MFFSIIFCFVCRETSDTENVLPHEGENNCFSVLYFVLFVERPQTLRTYSHTKEKRRIVPDADLLEDDGESSDSYLRASTDDVETPDDLDLHGDMDENALGELEWESTCSWVLRRCYDDVVVSLGGGGCRWMVRAYVCVCICMFVCLCV